MARYIVACLVISAFIAAVTAPASAGTVINYDTVDAIETNGSQAVRVTGVIAGQGVSSTTVYSLAGVGSNTDVAARCERFAMLAMSKPGKFQFAVVNVDFGHECKLIARNP